MSCAIHALASLTLTIGTALACGGCAAGVDGGHKLAKFHENDASAVGQARKGGTYFVAFRCAGTDALLPVPHTTRKVRKGEPIGFRRAEDKALIAVAGKSEIRFGEWPAQARYYCWYRGAPGRDSQSFGEMVGQALSGAAALGWLGGMEAVKGWAQGLVDEGANSDDSSDDVGTRRYGKSRHHDTSK
jgi:hypothetical protein